MNPATIIVRFTAQGFHHWPNAPVNRSYLRNIHRHLFHIEVQTGVTHDDREIEFHDLIDEARHRFRLSAQNSIGSAADYGPKSCEQLARELASALSLEYDRPFTVSVFEDGECGARVSVAPEFPRNV